MANGDDDLTKPQPAVAYLPGTATASPQPPPGRSSSEVVNERMMRALEGSQAEELRLRQQQAAETGPARERVSGAMRDYTRTADTELQRLRSRTQDIPEYKTPDIKQASFDWLAASATMGALAGAFSRYHSTTALNAFGAAMNGWYQGNLQVFQNKYAEWKANADRARVMNDRAQREYEMVLANKRLNLDQQMAEVEMIGAKYQDQIAIEAAKQKNVTQLAQLLDHREATAAKMAEAQAKLELDVEKINEGMAKLSPDRLNVTTPAGLEAGLGKIIDLYNSGPQGQAVAKLMWSKMWSGSSTPAPSLEDALGAADKSQGRSGLVAGLRTLFGIKDETAGAPAGSPSTAPGAPAAAGATPAATPAAPAAAPPAPTMIEPPPGSAPGTPPVQSPISRVQQALPTPRPMQGPPTGVRSAERNVMAGRDGSSEAKAIVLPRDRNAAAQAASRLPDGTWVILPPDMQPVQIKRATPTPPAARQAAALGALNNAAF